MPAPSDRGAVSCAPNAARKAGASVSRSAIADARSGLHRRTPWPGPPPVPPRPAPPGHVRQAAPRAAHQLLPADLREEPPCRDRITNPGLWLVKSALWLSGVPRPERMAWVSPVNSVEHIGELRRRN